MEPGNIYSRLESDISKWQKLLMDVKYVNLYNSLFMIMLFYGLQEFI